MDSTRDRDQESSRQEKPGPPERDAATEEPGGDGAVAIVDFAFGPSEVRIPSGTEVVWTNDDGSAHSIKDGNRLFDESAALDRSPIRLLLMR